MLRFMKNKILIPVIILGVLAAFFSFKYAAGDATSDERKAVIMETLLGAVKEGHYSPREINDTFSARVYDRIIGELDPEKRFFSQADMNELGKYKFKIDDEINSGSLEFYHKLNDVFTKRIVDAEKNYKEALLKPFTFTGNEEIQLYGDKLPYAKDDKALKDRWRGYMKYRVLGKYVDLKKAQNKRKEDKDTSLKTIKTDVVLEADARESIRKNQATFFKRLHKITEDDRFEIFMNAIANTEDPHTDYFAPKAKKRFDEIMSGTFYGIGAQLRDDGGKVKIVNVVTGSPCWKQGELKAGDEIMKVAQGEKEAVDVEGFDIDDVVQLIRGSKGSEVRLTVKQGNGAIKVIPITRGEVLLEDIFAHSAIIKSTDGDIGYIYLPEFYSDFQHINGRRCAEDVKKEVDKLKTAGVKGIILDLRNNGGGSLSDVVDMAGLFVGHGPVVQVKSSDAAPMTLRANDKAPLYDGPMAVMINQNSASASEIMAAAMQDYKRAVIVGSTTYGKGTVQKVISLDELLNPLERMKLANSGKSVLAPNGEQQTGGIGSLKITVQKFYRVNGGSTQLRGVTPDILLPDAYAMIDMGERHDKAALKWDEIAPADYHPIQNTLNVDALRALSTPRVITNPTFQLIVESAARLKREQDKNTFPLNEVAYVKELEENAATNKKVEELQKKTTPYSIFNPKEDMDRINADTASVAKNNDWIKNLKKDIYITETVNILNDANKQGMKVNNGMGMK
ncbi:MAG: carboxy terminal-processing peptidase [Taibaiella sp.]|nr:carboxy terminal-processing peptidase [Taibaiella sp.]